MAIRSIQGFVSALLIFVAGPVAFAQADNDLFENAQPLSGSQVQFSAFLGGASLEPGEPDHNHVLFAVPFGHTVSESLWYTWTSPTSGILDVRLSGWISSPVAALYRGNAVDQLTAISASVGSGGVAFPVEAGVEYRIAIVRALDPALEWTQEIPCSLQVVSMPTNDAFADAIVLNSADPHSFFVTPGTLEPGEPPQHTGGSLWWRWTADASGTASIVTTPAKPSGFWSVFEGESLATLKWIKSVPGTNSFPSPLVFPARSNATYYFAYSGLVEPLASTLLYAVVNPISLTSSVQSLERGGDLPLVFDILPSNPPTNATLRLEIRNALGFNQTKSWQPPFPSGFIVTNVPAGTNEYRLYYSEPHILPPFPPSPPLPQNSSLVAVPLPQNNSFTSDSLTFVVRHPNDAFADAELLIGTNLQFTVDFFGSSFETNEPPPFFPDDQRLGSVWFKWVAPHVGALRLSRVGPLFSDLSVDLFTGTALSNLQLVEGTPSIQYRVFRVQQGAEYFIRLCSAWDYKQTIELRLDPFPANDNFADAFDLPGTPVPADLSAATIEENEPNGPGTVWFKITPQADGLLECRVENATASIQVYSGTAVSNAVVVSDLRTSLNVPLSAGTTYHIQVGGLIGDAGPPWFHSRFTPIPPNDHFVDRTPLIVPQQMRVSLNAATIETNEPADPWRNASVWYSFTPAQSGVYLLDVNSFAVGNALSVYQGASLETLQQISPVKPFSPLYELSAGATYAVRLASDRNAEIELMTRFYGTTAPGDHFDQPLTSSATYPLFLATESPDDPLVTLPDGTSTQLKSTTWFVWTAPARGRFTLSAGGAVTWIVAFTNAPLNELKQFAIKGTSMELQVEQGQQYRFLIGSNTDLPDRLTTVSIGASFNTFEFVSPETGSIFTMGEPITVRMSDPIPGVDPDIVGVSFFGTRWSQPLLFGTATNVPFQITLSNLVYGLYEIRANAYTASGHSYALKPVTIGIQTEPFENDHFADALPISGRIFEQTLSTNAFLNSTIEFGEPGPTNIPFPGSLRGTLWYRWTASASGTVRATSAPYWGTEGVFWQGTALTNLISAPRTNSTFIVEKGEEYLIQLHVGGVHALRWTLNLETVKAVSTAWRTFYAGDQIDFALDVTEVPEDVEKIDLFWNGHLASTMTTPPWTSIVTHLPPGPIAPVSSVLHARSGELVTNLAGYLRVLPGNISPERATLLTTNNLTIDFSSFDRLGNTVVLVGPTLFYRYTPETNHYITIFSAKLAVTNAGTLEPVPPVPAAQWHSSQVFELSANVEYLLALTDPWTTNATFIFPTPPPNDHFTNAAPLVADGEPRLISWPVLATLEPGEPLPQPFAPLQPGTVWFYWTAPEDGLIVFSNTDSAVFTGNTVSNLTRLSPALDSSRYFAVKKNTTYRIAHYSYNLSETFFGATFTPGQIAEDRFADAPQLPTSGGVTNTLYLSASTYEEGEPSHGEFGHGSAWWKWIAPANGELWVWRLSHETDGVFGLASSSEIATRFLLYAGTALTNLTRQNPALSNFYGFIDRYPVTAGQSYYFMFDQLQGTPDDILLKVSFEHRFYPQPANDTVAGAQLLSGNSTSLSGAHMLASRDFGEPLHGGTYGGRSVWYRWHAERTGELSISIRHQVIPFIQGVPLLAVYHGPTLGALIASSKGQSLTNQLDLPVTAGEEYLIAVDFQGPLAEFTFNLNFTPAPLIIELATRTTNSIEFTFESDRSIVLESSTNLVDWTAFSRYSPGATKRAILPTTNGPAIFFRAIEQP